MTDGHFDYDAVSYVVSTQAAYRDYYPSYYSAGYGWSWPYRYGFGSCYDAFFYDPFYCGSDFSPFYDPFFFGGVGLPPPRPPPFPRRSSVTAAAAALITRPT